MSEIAITLKRPRVETLLSPYQGIIGDDYSGYRNHVYRTITYAMHFLQAATANTSAHSHNYEPLIETAFVYHDIGLWTARELAYLEPSEALAIADNQQHGWEFDPLQLSGIIYWHHKITPYRGPHQVLIEACRKADWVDASKGLLKKGLTKSQINAVEAAFPNHGFHQSLLRLAKNYGGSTLKGAARVTMGIMKW